MTKRRSCTFTEIPIYIVCLEGWEQVCRATAEMGEDCMSFEPLGSDSEDQKVVCIVY